MFALRFSRARASVNCSYVNVRIRQLASSIDETMDTYESSDADGGNELTISNAAEKRWVRPGAAYFVATPLGNVHDMSPRARAILCQVDIIVAEDTRTTRALLRRLDQTSPLPESVALRRDKQRFISHHKHNQRSSIDEVLRHISDRQSPVSIAVVGDAGTPGISDPGAPLAQVLHQRGVPIYSIPGPCAMAAALSVSGFTATPSLFVGFAPVKGKEREAWLERIDNVALRDATVVLYESPHRVLRTMRDIAKLSCCSTPRRRGVVMCRELTKRYEEVLRCDDVQQLLDILERRSGEPLDGESNDGAADSSIRGEFTLVLGPTERRPGDSDGETVDTRPSDDPDGAGAGSSALDALSSRFEQDSAAAHMLLRLVETTPSLKRSEAVRQVAVSLGLRKKQVYVVALKLPWPAS
jgi:16S rRNA (cytidine1402-2'-O)-methyltransferase